MFDICDLKSIVHIIHCYSHTIWTFQEFPTTTSETAGIQGTDKKNKIPDAKMAPIHTNENCLPCVQAK